MYIHKFSSISIEQPSQQIADNQVMFPAEASAGGFVGGSSQNADLPVSSQPSQVTIQLLILKSLTGEVFNLS